MYGWPRPFCELLPRTRLPSDAAPAEAPWPPTPGIATVPVKLTANALVSTPGMSGVTPLIRVLLPLKPSLVSLTTVGFRICCSVYTTFCGTPVTIWLDPVTSSGCVR